jgi:hypothetical protein
MAKVQMKIICIILILCCSSGQAASTVDQRVYAVDPTEVDLLFDFGLSPEMIQELYEAGLDNITVTKRLYELYPARPERLATEQIAKISVDLDVSSVHLLKAYQMGNKIHRDPMWLLSLWERTHSWEIVEAAFNRFAEASKVLIKEQSATETFVWHLASAYGISPGFVKEAVAIGIDPPTLLGILFYEDIYTLGKVVMPSEIGSKLPPDWRSGLPNITALNEFWPMRQLEGNLVQQIIKGREATK